jgi:hypothetical protein
MAAEHTGLYLLHTEAMKYACDGQKALFKKKPLDFKPALN